MSDVLAFFKHIDSRTPAGLDVHVILDNVSAHKSEPVRKWLSNPRRQRWHLHFTPTSSSWANLVECWFSVLTRKALKNRAFSSVAELQDAIDTWAQHWNHDPQPLKWTKQAQPVIDKGKRARTALHHATNPRQTNRPVRAPSAGRPGIDSDGLCFVFENRPGLRGVPGWLSPGPGG